MSIRTVPADAVRVGLKRTFDKFRSGEQEASQKEHFVVEDPRQAPPQTTDGMDRWPLPGLAPMTRVRTSFGDVHSIALRKGDEVLTRSGEHKPILWMNRIKLDQQILAQKPDCNPVVIGPRTMGGTVPASEVMISPRQIVCADQKTGLNSEREASMLMSRAGVRRLRETGLTYTMFHVGETAEIYCEGLYLRFALDA